MVYLLPKQQFWPISPWYFYDKSVAACEIFFLNGRMMDRYDVQDLHTLLNLTLFRLGRSLKKLDSHFLFHYINPEARI